METVSIESPIAIKINVGSTVQPGSNKKTSKQVRNLHSRGKRRVGQSGRKSKSADSYLNENRSELIRDQSF
jgi:hypothetical protein